MTVSVPRHPKLSRLPLVLDIRNIWTMTVTDESERIYTCQQCGRAFTPARSDAKFCDAQCRQRAHRARLAAEKPKTPRPPLGDGFRSASLDLGKMVDRWQRLVADDRFRRNRKNLVRYRGDLVRARDALSEMIDQFD